MNTVAGVNRIGGLSMRQAALVTGICYVLMPVAFAEFYVFPKLVVAGHIEQTAENIAAHGQLFFVGILCHFITLVLDLVIGWALYVLLAPVNQGLSLLTAWFRLTYAGIYLSGLSKLLAVLRLLSIPYYRMIFGEQQLLAQVQFQLNSFRYSLNLAFFGIHLILLGYLIYKSSYIPRFLGAVLIVVGVGWIINGLRPYLFPNAPLGFIPVLGFGELLFPLWLLFRGSKFEG